MAQVVLGAVGAGIGATFGGAGAQWGFSAGVMLAGILFPPRAQRQDHGKLDDLRISGSQYGAMIPQVFGKGRVGGMLIWVETDANGNHLRESSRAIRASKGGSRTVGRKYSYSCTMAWLVCRGPIQGIRRIWAEDKLIYEAGAVSPTKYQALATIYLGDESQTVDPDIDAAEGEDWTAYRGLAYVVFDDFPLEEWGNRVPGMTFEVNGIGGATDPDDGLLAWYRFEDDPGLLVDSGPSGYTLSQTSSGATQVTGPTGYGEGLDFGASGNNLSHNAGDLPAWQGSEFSVSARFKYDGVGTGTVICWYRSTGFDYAPNLEISAASTGFVGSSAGNADGFFADVVLKSGGTIKDGNWHHVVVTVKIGGKYRLYYDGVLEQEEDCPYSDATIPGGGDLIELDQGDFYLDEVKWYSRELTAAEIGGSTSGPSVGAILRNLFVQVGLADDDIEES